MGKFQRNTIDWCAEQQRASPLFCLNCKTFNSASSGLNHSRWSEAAGNLSHTSHLSRCSNRRTCRVLFLREAVLFSLNKESSGPLQTNHICFNTSISEVTSSDSYAKENHTENFIWGSRTGCVCEGAAAEWFGVNSAMNLWCVNSQCKNKNKGREARHKSAVVHNGWWEG